MKKNKIQKEETLSDEELLNRINQLFRKEDNYRLIYNQNEITIIIPDMHENFSRRKTLDGEYQVITRWLTEPGGGTTDYHSKEEANYWLNVKLTICKS